MGQIWLDYMGKTGAVSFGVGLTSWLTNAIETRAIEAAALIVGGVFLVAYGVSIFIAHKKRN